MKIAFIGLGTMGIPIANNLANHSFSVKGWDKYEIKKEKLSSKIIFCETIHDLSDCDLLITMVPDDKAIREIAHHSFLFEHVKTWINLSTTSLSLLDEMNALARNQFTYHTIPVMGRFDVAEKGELDVYTSGHQDELELIKPILKSFSKKLWYFGHKKESALLVKLVGNFLLNATIETLGEAFALITKGGIDQHVFADVILNSMFDCPVYKLYTHMIVDQAYEPPGFKLKLGLKDINLILEAAERNLVPLPYASIVKNHFIECLSHNEGNLDESAIALSALRHSNQLI